jgi:uncharacterized protein (TIGR00255 family)
MPVYSMTGYASGQNGPIGSHSEADPRPPATGRLGVEIRSVNSRFLDLTFKLPEELRQHEPALRDLIIGRLKRGKVEVRASIESNAQAGVSEPSVKLLQRLNGMQDGIKAWLPSARDLSVADVLRLAGGDGAAVRGDWAADLSDVTSKALDALMSARQREGARLAKMLEEHLGQLRALAKQAVPLVPKLVEQQRAKFLERWQDAMGLTGGTLPEAAQDRALTEATAFAIRIDVAEELTRLNSHLDEIERLVKKGGEIGKRLDFLIQELHREANTLGAKSAALELTRIGVDMKVLIEQMREQVQNIE